MSDRRSSSDAQEDDTTRTLLKLNEATTTRFGTYVDIILVLLGISLLSVWGAFGRLGQTTHNICVKQESETAHLFVWIMILVGLTFGLYSSLRNKVKDGTPQAKQFIFGVLLVMHTATLGIVWWVYWHVIDFASESASCDEFFGQQHMFLNVVFMGLIISAIYVYYALCDSFTNAYAKALGHGVLYAGIVAIFFYYASSDGDDSTTWDTDSHQRTMVYAFSFTTLGVYLVMKYWEIYNRDKVGSTLPSWLDKIVDLFVQFVPRRADLKDDVDRVKNAKHRKKTTLEWESITTAFCCIAVIINIGFAAAVARTDLEHIADGVDNTNNPDLKDGEKSATGCLGDHDDILGMGITVIGYWTLYIMLLAVVLMQYISQFYDAVAEETAGDANEVYVIKWFGNWSYYYRDTFDGFQIPTILVVITWVWLLVGGILHHGELDEEKCGSNKSHEEAVFWTHTAAVVLVLLAFPRLHGSTIGHIDQSTVSARSMEDVKAPVGGLRPTNRFTTRAQVAVDVNTPLNFA